MYPTKRQYVEKQLREAARKVFAYGNPEKSEPKAAPPEAARRKCKKAAPAANPPPRNPCGLCVKKRPLARRQRPFCFRPLPSYILSECPSRSE